MYTKRAYVRTDNGRNSLCYWQHVHYWHGRKQFLKGKKGKERTREKNRVRKEREKSMKMRKFERMKDKMKKGDRERVRGRDENKIRVFFNEKEGANY